MEQRGISIEGTGSVNEASGTESETGGIRLDITPNIPTLPRIADKTKIDVRYVLIAPYVSVHIYFNKEQGELIYEVEEPVLTSEEREILSKIETAMRELINVDVVVEKTQEALIDYINKTAKLIISELSLRVSDIAYNKIFYYLFRNFIGLNEIEPLIRDYFIEDIECNGMNTPVYIVHRMYRNIKTNIVFNSVPYLASFVEKLAQRAGRYISYASPILDGTLPGGERINATYTTDITTRGPTFSIRKFTKVPWTPVQLIAMNSASPEMLSYLWLLLEYKGSILITGGTGSGKTTLLNAIAFFIPPEARVVSIEDTRELNIPRENWLPSVARAGIGIGGIGEVDLFALLKSSFRQNPNYVIVGEVRGKEAFVLFQGMASGHSSLSTMHADSVDTVIKRLETPPIELPPTLLTTLDAVAIMAHAVVNKQETRKLREIVEIVDVNADGIALTNTPFAWDSSEDKFYSKKAMGAFEKISKRYGLSMEQLSSEFVLRARLLYEMYKKSIFGFEEVQKIINDYYKNPEEVLHSFGIK